MPPVSLPISCSTVVAASLRALFTAESTNVVRVHALGVDLHGQDLPGPVHRDLHHAAAGGRRKLLGVELRLCLLHVLLHPLGLLHELLHVAHAAHGESAVLCHINIPP